MSTAVQPGTRLAERFRLEDRVTESDGATLWKAIDEILARPVAVLTFSPGFERVTEVVTAARAASRLTDPRITQVFDAAHDDDLAYVVSEWVTGESLADLLAAGPLDPERAAGLVAEASEALAHAHEKGLHHLCLRPSHLVWTTGNTVKVLGVAVDASLAGLTTDNPALDDAEGLGRLLYAGLTGHWPGDEEEGGLPAAPMIDGHFCTPRQVTAGVPGYLDTITSRACLPESRRGQSSLASPAEMAEALSDVPRPVPLALSYSSPPPSVSASPSEGLEEKAPPTWTPPPRPPSKVNRILMTLVVLLVIVAVGFGAWTIGRNLGTQSSPSAGNTTGSSDPASQPSAAQLVALKPAGADGFDPLGDDRSEHPEMAAQAIDGKPNTFWQTTYYNSAELGRLKDGVGLLIDMGKQVPVSQVVATLAETPGSSVELRVGNSPSLDALKPVATQKDVSGKVTFTPSSPASGQYVLIWFTRLPAEEGRFRGTIYDVVVHSPGSA
ncbi:protein kinase family protein [Nonomuraea soli]|uniref:Serine/threonine protein kinase n=1 Tax=Nonomuraea soli TaxID=1032476 RepID=A0A7W0HQI0_9ACTN|nr:protein kinase family protein [Nonomuraea soli]MBA2891832.1 serine/threonine protein kinase [Nonomuraea soli]